MSIYRCLLFALKNHIMILQFKFRGENMTKAELSQIGARIQKRRRQQQLTQEQLADRMNVSIQMISNLERGNKAIRIDNLIHLCQILDISTDFILTGKEEKSGILPLTERIALLPERDRRAVGVLVDFFLEERPRQ